MANEEQNINNTNGYYGMVQSPFAQDEELLGETGKIIQQCKNNSFNYISKLGIHYVGDYDLDLNPSDSNYTNYDGINHPIIVKINNMSFQIGKTRMLELEDVHITSIIFPKEINHDLIYVDYQYK